MSGRVFTTCHNFERKNIPSETFSLAFSKTFSLPLVNGNKQKSLLGEGGGGQVDVSRVSEFHLKLLTTNYTKYERRFSLAIPNFARALLKPEGHKYMYFF